MDNRDTDRGDLLVRAGAIVFAVGSIATLVTFVPLFFDLPRLPTAAYWLCMLMPLGFLIALVGLVQGARAQKRRTQQGSQAG